MTSTINASSTGSGGIVQTADASGVLALQANGTTAFTVNSDATTTFANAATLSGGTANGVAYLNGSKVLTTGSAFVFDGTNVGIGTSSPIEKLTVNGNIATNASQSYVYSNGGSGSSVNSGFFLDGSGSTLRMLTGNSERARIDSTGRLGVGTTSFGSGSPAGSISFAVGANIQSGSFGRMWVPGQQIGQASFAGLYGIAQTYLAYYSSGWKSLGGGTASAITIDEGIFSFSSSQSVGGADSALSWTTRFMCDTSGNLLVGTTSSLSGKLMVAADSAGTVYPAVFNNTNTGSSNQIVVDILRNSSRTGYITNTNTTTSFTSTSDYRLKEQVQPMTGALAKVSALKPVTYKWKVDGSDGQGFIAHELAEIVPDCVSGKKDAVDANGNPQYQGIDTSFLVATLTAAIQEQQALITSLTARIEALESR